MDNVRFMYIVLYVVYASILSHKFMFLFFSLHI